MPNSDNCSAVIGPRRKMSILPFCIDDNRRFDSVSGWPGIDNQRNVVHRVHREHARAVVGLTRPNRFALGAASGLPNARMISAKTGCALIRTATVSRPAVTMSGTISRFGKTIVNGPGQNCLAKFQDQLSILSREHRRLLSSQSRSGKWTIRGSKCGRSFASKIFATAIGLSASAARP